ncbi:hypothetical protein PR048_008232 [Dryococelus australis]|uniref:Uncharacterized protein n=1 Tax=Dryococelus australis TaxID=614101 RepID=A0ABQ9HWM0_9NEOP|nr:hypothetical protein PR048_008232 [Dryococelus australis]
MLRVFVIVNLHLCVLKIRALFF